MNVRPLLKALFVSVPRVRPADRFDEIRGGAALLVDVRETPEWRDGVAWNAALLPLSDLLRQRHRWRSFLETVSGRDIVLYCGVGVRAAIAGKLLATEGFRTTNGGGLKEWAASGWPVVKVERLDPKPL